MAKCTKCETTKTALYGLPGGKPVFCKMHAIEAGPQYVDVHHKQCAEVGCSKRPWVQKNKPKTSYCNIHCVEGIVAIAMEKIITNVIKECEPTIYRYCRNVDCSKLKTRANYGLEPKKPLFCGKHQDKTIHKDVTHPMCIIEKCGIRAGYGDKGKLPIYCSKHGNLKGYGDITKKECSDEDCKTIATYACEGEPPKYCSKCADHNTMKNVVSPRCLNPVCFKRRRYGFDKDMKPLYCAEHADKNTMKDVLGSKCKYEGGCSKSRGFGYEEDMKALYCAEHADHSTMVDVKSPRCKFIGCTTQPTFGIKSGRVSHCKAHHDKKTMTGLHHKLCEMIGCTRRPTFGIDKGVAIYCDAHAVGKGMRDVLNPRCIECKVTTVNRNYKPYCSSCFYDLNPAAERTINFKTKELAFTKVIAETYPNIVLDKVIQGGSSKYRPDALLDLGTHCVMIEIDEGSNCWRDLY